MARQDFPGRVGWLRRLCGGLVAEAMWGVRNAGNKAQLRPAGAGALPELGKIMCHTHELSAMATRWDIYSSLEEILALS